MSGMRLLFPVVAAFLGSVLIALPVRSQEVLDQNPGDIASLARTEEGTGKLYSTLYKMDTGGVIAEVPHLAPDEKKHHDLFPGDSIKTLLAEYQSAVLANSKFYDQTAALVRVKKQGRIDYKALKDQRMQAVYESGNKDGEAIFVSEKFKDYASKPTHRRVVGALLAHEATHALHQASGLEDEILAHQAQCDYLQGDEEGLFAGAAASLQEHDPAIQKLYKHSIDLLDACKGKRLREFVRKNYRDEDLH